MNSERTLIELLRIPSARYIVARSVIFHETGGALKFPMPPNAGQFSIDELSTLTSHARNILMLSTGVPLNQNRKDARIQA